MTDPSSEEVDVLVVGSGAAGLSAALFAAAEGLRVLVVEKTEYVGGTTAYSAGTCWMPGHIHLADEEAVRDREAGARYLDALVGSRAPQELRRRYLEAGPEMLRRLEALGVRFTRSATVVDYHPELPGAGIGRALEPVPFDGRRLGRAGLRRVRPPIPEFSLFGGTLMVRRVEADRLLRIFRGSPRAVLLALRLGVRWVFDMLRYPRGTRLTMGNALAATLYHRLLEEGGVVQLSSTVKRLVQERGRVVGAVVEAGGRERRVDVTCGVVLAGGGFAASRHYREAHLPTPTPQFSPAAPGATGDSLELGLAVGAVLGDHDDNAFWFPSSIGTRRNGSLAVFPHIWDRAKPGIIAVGSAGRRFTDESVSYHRFTRAMYAQQRLDDETVPGWLIVDSRSLRRYGLGMIRPRATSASIDRRVESGYIHRADTITSLAASIGVDGAGLVASVERNNRDAAHGEDSEFGKGTSPFGRQYGDPEHRPNANLGPIERAPFFALPVVPTPLATAAGLRIDTEARVLDVRGDPVPGLYACGNDADSIMAAEYPGAGCQIGAGLVFGYLAARDAAREDAARAAVPSSR